MIKSKSNLAKVAKGWHTSLQDFILKLLFLRLELTVGFFLKCMAIIPFKGWDGGS